jgi:hypothetical protein
VNLHIHARIATNCVVAPVVDAHCPQSEVLHLVLEAEDTRIVLDEVDDLFISRLVRRLGINVANSDTGGYSLVLWLADSEERLSRSSGSVRD